METDHINRRNLLKMSGAALATSFAGCVSGGGGGGGGGQNEFSPMDVEEFPVSDLEDTFNLWNWYDGFANYTREQFPQAHSTVNTVNVSGYSSPSQWFTKLQSGNHSIDNIGATGEYVGRALDSDKDLIHPLPVENMPSWEHIPQSYKDDVNEYFSDDDGNLYCMPEATVVAPALGYNTEHFDKPPTSWEILWDESLEGQVTMWDRSYIAGSLAARVAGQDWRNPSDWSEIEELLKQQKPLNKTYWTEYQSGMQLFINEEVVAGPMTMGRLYTARFDNDAPINYVIPEEGTQYSMDQFIVPTEAPHPRVSTQFLNWAAKPKNAVKLFTTMGYKPAVNGLEEQLKKNDISQNKIDFVSWTDNQQNRMDFQAPLDPEVQQKYDDIWTTVKAS
jgi:spermidine/putrescine transport system substrate-binding protein